MATRKRGTVAAMNTKVVEPDCRWMDAVSRWLEGEPAPLTAALRDRSLEFVSENARELLADLVEGKEVRDSGRKREWAGVNERAIVMAVFVEWEKQLLLKRQKDTPKIRACREVARQRELKEDAVRGTVTRSGITFKWWQAMRKQMKDCGRPDWSL